MSRSSTMPTNFKRYAKTIGKNLSAPELAESFKVSDGTIYNWLKLVGISRQPRSNSVSKVKITRLLEKGLSVREIMGLVGCSDTTIKNVRREMKREVVNGK
jgi:transposase